MLFCLRISRKKQTWMKDWSGFRPKSVILILSECDAGSLSSSFSPF